MVQMTYQMPCLHCGRLLTGDTDTLRCECGVEYAREIVDRHRAPGYYREWTAALACTCGRVQREGDTMVVTAHRCRAGGIGMLDRSN